MAPHPGRVAMTLTSSKHCSVRVVILRLRFQVQGFPLGCSGGKPDLWKKWFPVPQSQEQPLRVRKCGPCPSRLGPECWAGFVEKFGTLEEVQTKFSEDVRVTRIACLVKVKAGKSRFVRGRAFLQGRSCSGASLASLSAGQKPRRGQRLDWIGFEPDLPRSALQASMSLCHKTRPTQSSRSLRSSRRRLGCTRSKSLCPIRGWDHGLDVKRCSTCPTICVALVGAIHATPNGEQPENTGPRHSSSNDGWNTQCIGIRALLGNASRFKTQFALAARAVTSLWSIVADASLFGMGAILYSSELVPQAYGLRSSGSGTWRDSAHVEGRPCVPIRMGVAGSFLFGPRVL